MTANRWALQAAALGLGCSALAWAASGNEVRFTREPTVAVEKDQALIRFEISRPSDVAVYIQDAQGQIIRHLAAGVLGKDAPAPLKAGSLEQTLVWDGKDDLGQPAKGGPFRVRVALGLTPRFEAMIGDEPRDVGSVRGLAVGPNGDVYVFHAFGSHHPHTAGTAVCVFDRSGKYLRTIVPYPTNLGPEKLTGLKRLTLPGGGTVPFIYEVGTRQYLPGLGDLPCERPVVTTDGRLAFTGILNGPSNWPQPDESRLMVIGTDGSVPAGGALRTSLAPATDNAPSLALSPDEKTLYAVGARGGVEPTVPGPRVPDWNVGETWRSTKPVHAVYRFGFNDKEATVFVGDPEKAGSGQNELDYPVSVATDGPGNVYVADLRNNRIAVFKSDGTPLAQIPVKEPQRVEVHRKTGAVYVLAGYQTHELIRFEGWRTKREVARLTVGRGGFYPVRRPVIALDDRTDPPIIWLNQPFVRIEDKGDAFGEPLDLRAGTPSAFTSPVKDRPASLAAVWELSLDRKRGWLYINNYWRYDTTRGTWETLPRPPKWGSLWPGSSPYASSGAVGLDGNYYISIGAHAARIYRYGPDLKAIPFPKGGAEEGAILGNARNRSRGFTADAAGNVYMLWKKFGEQLRPGDAYRSHGLFVYGPDGALKRKGLIDAAIPSVNSIRLDPAGNLYVMAGMRQGRDQVPEDLKSQVGNGREDPDAVNGVNGYPLIYGSIIKFPPTGGDIRAGEGITGKGVVGNFAHGFPIEVRGAEWIVNGASPAISWSTPKAAPGTYLLCLCESPRFDVDGFGRSFFPDAGRCRVGVLDTAGNVICWFGQYGNADDRGPGIPLAWPQAVAVGDDAVYVGDRVNRRIVVVRLRYAAERMCPAPFPGGRS